MRIVIGALSLLVVLAIVGVLAKKQLGRVQAPAPAPTATGAPAAAGAATSKQQADAVKQQVEGLMQQPRPSADEGK